MNCGNVRRLLSAYCDAELPSERRAAMRRHVHNCESCTDALDAFKKLCSLTAQWGDVQPAASLWQALAPKLVAEMRTPAEPEEMAVSPDPSQQRASAKRSFKPVLEGLEDRYPLSDLVCAAGVTIAFSVIEPARACLRADGVWATMPNSAAGASAEAAQSVAFDSWGDVSGSWVDFCGTHLAAVA